MIHSARAWRRTNRYYTGSEDLDAYGRWQNVPRLRSDLGSSEQRVGRDRDGNSVWEPC